MSRLLMRFLLLTSLILAGGCASGRLDPAAWQDERISMVWPPSRDQARIKLLRVIEEPEDVRSGQKGGMSRFLEFLLGAREEYVGFFTPQCIAADGNGLIYIADPSLGAVHRYDLAAREVRYIIQAGSRQLSGPVGVALDREGNLYVTDTRLAAVFKFDRDGALIRELDSRGSLKKPVGIAITSKGEKLVADMGSNRVFRFGADDLLAGELAVPAGDEPFNMPTYLAVDAADTVYVTDSMNFRVRGFASDGRATVAVGQPGDGPGSFARPKGIATDSDGNLYVLDAIFGNFQIFDARGRLLLYVGQEGNRPGEMMLPSGIFIDREDRIYVSDTFNHRIQVFQYLKEGNRK